MRRRNRNKRSDGGTGKGTTSSKRPTATLDLQAQDLTPETKAIAAASEDQAKDEMAESVEKPSGDAHSSEDQTGKDQAAAEHANGGSKRATKGRSWLNGVAGLMTHIAAGLAGGVVVLGIATQFGWIGPAGDVGEISNAEITNQLAAFEKKLDASQPDKSWGDLLKPLRSRLEKAEKSVGGLQKKTAELTKDKESLEVRFKDLLSASRAGGGNNLAAAAALNDRIGEIVSRLDEKIASLKRDLGESNKQTTDDLSKRVAKKATEDEVEALRRLLRDGTERFLRDVQTISSETRDLHRTVSGLERQIVALQTQSEKVSEVSQSLQPVNRQIAALEDSIKGLVQRERKMHEGSRRAALAIALTSLRRAVDGGSPFAKELNAVRNLAPKDLLLKELEQVKDTGVPTAAALERSFPAMIKAVLDADTAKRQQSVIGQLLSNARSIVRVRRTGEIAGDSTEAVIARMEMRAKSGNLSAAVEEAGGLKGEALKEAEPWLQQVRARSAVDWAMRRVETELVTVLGGAGLNGDESKKK